VATPNVPKAEWPRASSGSAQPNLTPEQLRCWNLAQSYAEPPSKDGKAVASMVLGILSILIFFIFTGIPAVILGHISLAKIRKSKGRLTGDATARAGLVLGYISIAFSLLVILTIVPNMAMRDRFPRGSGDQFVRVVNTAQIAYSTTYLTKGYAVDLATLGPGPSGSCAGEVSAEHACQVDSELGNFRCTAGVWCPVKTGVRVSMSAICEGDGICKDYVVATTGGPTNICSTSDAVVRIKPGPRLTTLITPEECQSWAPLNPN
jgi:hypothetical protein